MKRKIFNFSLIVLVLGTITGCNRNAPEQGEQNQNKEEFAYVSTFHEYQTDFTWVNSAIALKGELFLNEQWYYNRPISKLVKINIETGERVDGDIELADNRYIADIVKTSEGYLVYSEEYVIDEAKSDYGIYELGASYLGYYDENLTLLRETDITNFVIGKSSFSQMCEVMTVDSDGNVYFYYTDTVYVVGNDGKQIAEVELNAVNVLDMTFVDNQVMLLYTDPNNKTTIAPIDLENNCMGQPLNNVPDSSYWGKIFAGEDGEFYFSTADYLYRYDLLSRQWNLELKWLDCDLDGLGLHHCIYADGRIVCVEYSNLAYEVTVLKKVPMSQVREKEILTVTMLKKDYILLDQVSKFNRKSQDIRLESKYYVESDSPDELGKGIQQFQLDLISGDIGDIIFVSAELDYDNLASKGAFYGLDELLEKDPELSKDDLIESITEIFSVDEKLYGIVPNFSIYTLAGKKSDVGEDDGWTVTDMAKLLKEREGAVLLDNVTKSHALKTFLSGSLDSYCDISTGECTFDSEEFKLLLQILNEFPEEIVEYNDDYLDLKNGTTLLESVFFYDYTVLRGYRALFGEDINFIGYPTSMGSGNLATVGNGVYTISAYSEHKDAAWQFIRQFLLDEYQNSGEFSFPINKNAFENMLTEEMNRGYPENYSYNFYGVELENVPMSEEDAQYIRDLVNGITQNNSYDYRLMNLILEEAESYFSGQKSIDEVVAIIQNRAQLYVDENN